MEKIKIIIVDDHKIVRDGVRAMLLGNKEVTMIGEADNANQLFDLLEEKTPDVLVLDIDLGGGLNGIDIAKRVQNSHPKIKILMLTANTSESCIVSSIRAGARGFLSKDTPKEEFITALKALKFNQMFFGENISHAVMASYVRNVKSNQDDYEQPLSERELEITRQLCEGKTAKQIGEQLCISSRTVETHKNNIFKKLGVQNTIELVKYAIKAEIISI